MSGWTVVRSPVNSIALSPPNEAANWSCSPIGRPSLPISMYDASSATSCLVARRWHSVASALMSATATVLELPRPVPGGISLAVNTARPRVTPNSCRMDLRYPSSPSNESVIPGAWRSKMRKSEEVIWTASSIVRVATT